MNCGYEVSGMILLANTLEVLALAAMHLAQ
jgi:hypothetical protein